jgi:thiaminase (transcriptional activator TenA)
MQAGLPQKALDTKFMQGIKSGTLDPNVYGQYVVQDCAYCYYGADDWANAAARALKSDQDESHGAVLFALDRFSSYKNYNEVFLPQWHIKDATALGLTATASKYIAFEKEVAEKRDIIFMVLAMLPCDKLWGWLANQLQQQSYKAGLYKSWIDENAGPHPGEHLESFIDKHENAFDFKTMDWIMKTGLTFEVNMFRSACGETLLPYPPE